MSSLTLAWNSTYLPFRGVENNTANFLSLNSEAHGIRYITLEPGRGREPLVCRLGHTILDEAPSWRIQYEAVSYCWGDAADTVDIEVHLPSVLDDYGNATGHAANRHRVTRNLQGALFSLRSSHVPRILWIDALCINQADPKEKTLQVKMMNLIYSKAEKVTIWLGEDDKYSHTFVRYCQLLDKTHIGKGQEYSENRRISRLQCIQRLAAEKLLRRARQWTAEDFTPAAINDAQLQDILISVLGQKHGPLSFKGLQSPVAAQIARHIRKGFVRFVSRPWFKRIWVYQEVLLAPIGHDGFTKATMFFGDRALSWKDFSRTVHDLDALLTGNMPDTSTEDHVLEFDVVYGWFALAWGWLSSTSVRTRSFVYNYESTFAFLASDPRDKLFALLHISSNTRTRLTEDTLMWPNYEKTIPEIILDFSQKGIHLPLAIRTAPPTNETISTDKHEDVPDDEGDLEFTFWNTQYWNTRDHPHTPLQANLETNEFYVIASSPVRGRVVSPIIHACELEPYCVLTNDWSWKLELYEGAMRAFISKAFNDIVSSLKEQVLEREDATVMSNVLNMLGSQGNHGAEGLLLAWRRLLDHAGEIASLQHHHEAQSDTRVKFFIDSRGRLLVSHSKTQPGDLVVEVEHSASSFVMSSSERHFQAPDARWDTQRVPVSSLHERQDELDQGTTFLFLGVCSIYPGETKYQKP